MSWHYSQALEAEYLAASCLDGERSAQWKSMPTAPDDLCSGKMKDTFHRSPYGMMFVPLTDGHGEELLAWYLAGFLVQTSAQPGRKLASRESKADYGWKWPGSFAKYDPDMCTWRTRQHSLLGGLEEFLETWPAWGLMLDGECLVLPTLALPTKESDAGSWLTPCHGTAKWGGTFQEVGGSLNKLRNTPTGKLYVNPDFWESLMGWPIGWTGIAPLATAKMQEWLKLHGDPYG